MNIYHNKIVFNNIYNENRENCVLFIVLSYSTYSLLVHSNIVHNLNSLSLSTHYYMAKTFASSSAPKETADRIGLQRANGKPIDQNYLIISDMAIPQINQTFVLAITTWTGYLFLVDANPYFQNNQLQLQVFFEYPALPNSNSTMFQSDKDIEYHDPLTAVCFETTNDLTVYFGSIFGKVCSVSANDRKPRDLFICGGPVHSMKFNDGLFVLSLDGKIHILRNDIYQRLQLPMWKEELPVAFDVNDQKFVYITSTTLFYSEDIGEILRASENVIDQDINTKYSDILKANLHADNYKYTCVMIGSKSIMIGTDKGAVIDSNNKVYPFKNINIVNSITAKEKTLYAGGDFPELCLNEGQTQKTIPLNIRNQNTTITKLIASNDTTDNFIKIFAVTGYDWHNGAIAALATQNSDNAAPSSNIHFIKRPKAK